MTTRAGESSLSDLLAAALADVVGPALVVDDRLRLVHATVEASRLIGDGLEPGVSVVKALCGDAPKRPIAEALAEGRAVTGAVVRPGPDGALHTVEVRATPIGGPRRLGWLLRLDLGPGDDGVAADAPIHFHGLWTRDPGMKRVLHIVERAAAREVSVLIRGPSGSGKELVARAIHALSSRRAGAFRAINCAALPATLLESELFGHKKGAFTGAVADSPGIFRAAHKGTLFLDEVAEMPLELQAKLLRVLETKTIIPVGATEPIAVDVRIVAATHQSLRQAVEATRFRADLMYRLRVVPVFLPALAARRGDVELLTDKLIEELNRQGGRRVARVAPAAREALATYAWPGNVRELRNALEYAYVIGEGSVLTAAELPPEVTGQVDDAAGLVNAPPIAAGDPETARIRLALERAGGNRDRAARMLGMSRVTLWRRMRDRGLA